MSEVPLYLKSWRIESAALGLPDVLDDRVPVDPPRPATACRVQGSGVRVQSSDLRVAGSGFRFQG